MINSEINSEHPTETNPDERVDGIVAAGPHGALVLAAITTAGVMAMWLAFYFFVFMVRGPLQ